MTDILKKMFSRLVKLNGRGEDEAPPGLDIYGRGKEYYETLRYSLLKPEDGTTELPRIIAVTSCNRREGVSTIASSLAVTLSLHGDRVLFIDANFRHPSAQQIFRVNPSPGLGEVFYGGIDITAAIQPSSIENLFILSTGETKKDPAHEYESPEFIELLNIFKRDYGYVVFDAPPMQRAGNSAVRLAGIVDGVILVVESEKIRWEVAQRMKAQLIEAKANLLGIVLNKRKFHVPRWLYDTL